LASIIHTVGYDVTYNNNTSCSLFNSNADLTVVQAVLSPTRQVGAASCHGYAENAVRHHHSHFNAAFYSRLRVAFVF